MLDVGCYYMQTFVCEMVVDSKKYSTLPLYSPCERNVKDRLQVKGGLHERQSVCVRECERESV